MRRREFIVGLGGAAAWPMVAWAQQPMTSIGFLNPTSPESNADRLRGFRQGIGGAGYIEGENVIIDYRWAEGQNDRLPKVWRQHWFATTFPLSPHSPPPLRLQPRPQRRQSPLSLALTKTRSSLALLLT